MNGNHEMTALVAVNAIAKEYEGNGYHVMVEPDPSVIPFDLNNYRPDILATKGDENLIIEVKTRKNPKMMERYKEILRIVNQHKGWRFLLATVDEPGQPGNQAANVVLEEPSIAKAFRELEPLLQSDMYKLAVPYLWQIYMSGVRLVADKLEVPVDITSDRGVLDYMYSLGEISFEDYEASKKYFELRSKLVHFLGVNVSREQVDEVKNFVEKKLSGWGLLGSVGSA